MVDLVNNQDKTIDRIIETFTFVLMDLDILKQDLGQGASIYLKKYTSHGYDEDKIPETYFDNLTSRMLDDKMDIRDFIAGKLKYGIHEVTNQTLIIK
jgi:hypothetical protein